MSTLERNWVDAIHYYRKSTTAARAAGEKQLIHVAYHNLVHLCLRSGRRRDAENYLEEYETLVDPDLTNDLVELTNLRLQVARQLEAQGDVKKEVDRAYELVAPRLEGEKWLSFQVSALGVAYDSGLAVSDILSVIAQHFPEYRAMNMPASYYALKEILWVLGGMRAVDGRDHAHGELYDVVLQYMRFDSYDDLSRYVQQLPDYAVFVRCEMEREKVSVVKERHQPYDFDQVYRMMQNIQDIYRTSGLLVEAIRADLDIADEAVRARRKDVIAQHIEAVEQNLGRLKSHPFSVEAFLRVSFYLFFFIGRLRESITVNSETLVCRSTISLHGYESTTPCSAGFSGTPAHLLRLQSANHSAR